MKQFVKDAAVARFECVLCLVSIVVVVVLVAVVSLSGIYVVKKGLDLDRVASNQTQFNESVTLAAK